jgi:hypothetical protein
MPDLTPHTEDRVLEAKIEGLSKLTDERFSAIQQTLSRIETNSKGYVTRLEIDEIKKDFTGAITRIETAMTAHFLDDKESFSGLDKGQKEVRDTLLKWGAIGGTTLFILSFLSPVILKYWFNI